MYTILLLFRMIFEKRDIRDINLYVYIQLNIKR